MGHISRRDELSDPKCLLSSNSKAQDLSKTLNEQEIHKSIKDHEKWSYFGYDRHFFVSASPFTDILFQAPLYIILKVGCLCVLADFESLRLQTISLTPKWRMFIVWTSFGVQEEYEDFNVLSDN